MRAYQPSLESVRNATASHPPESDERHRNLFLRRLGVLVFESISAPRRRPCAQKLVGTMTPPGGLMERCKNVFEAILKYGHDEDWLPEKATSFAATDAPAGSPEKIEILRKRLE